MNFELCLNLVAHLLNYHVLCPDDESGVFIDKAFKNGFIRNFKAFRAWLRKERVGDGARPEDSIMMYVGPKLQEKLKIGWLGLTTIDSSTVGC
jgi:hypothetical protein